MGPCPQGNHGDLTTLGTLPAPYRDFMWHKKTPTPSKAGELLLDTIPLRQLLQVLSPEVGKE